MNDTPERQGDEDDDGKYERAERRFEQLLGGRKIRAGTVMFSQPWRPFGLRVFERRR